MTDKIKCLVELEDPAKACEAIDRAITFVLDTPGGDTQLQLETCKELVRLKKALQSRDMNFERNWIRR